MNNKEPRMIYCGDCGEIRTEEHPIAGYCPKHLLEHTPAPEQSKEWETILREAFEPLVRVCEGATNREIALPAVEKMIESLVIFVFDLLESARKEGEFEWDKGYIAGYELGKKEGKQERTEEIVEMLKEIEKEIVSPRDGSD